MFVDLPEQVNDIHNSGPPTARERAERPLAVIHARAVLYPVPPRDGAGGSRIVSFSAGGR